MRVLHNSGLLGKPLGGFNDVDLPAAEIDIGDLLNLQKA